MLLWRFRKCLRITRVGSIYSLVNGIFMPSFAAVHPVDVRRCHSSGNVPSQATSVQDSINTLWRPSSVQFLQKVNRFKSFVMNDVTQNGSSLWTLRPHHAGLLSHVVPLTLTITKSKRKCHYNCEQSLSLIVDYPVCSWWFTNTLVSVKLAS